MVKLAQEKQNSERNSKSHLRKEMLLLKNANMVSLAARNSMDEYTDEEIIVQTILELILCSLIGVYYQTLSGAPAPAEYPKPSLFSIVQPRHSCSRTNKLVFHDTEVLTCNQKTRIQLQMPSTNQNEQNQLKMKFQPYLDTKIGVFFIQFN